MPPKKAKDQSAEYAYYPGKCKPIVDDLPPAEELRRIQDLATYVREMQEALPQNERGDFCNLFAHVTRTDLLKRSAQKAENAVSLGCCIADLLRVFAPHPPTLEERRMLEVLLFMVSGLKALDLSGHIFDQALYLLENIATLESLKLGLQLPGFQDILRKMIITSLNVFNARDDVVLGKPPNVDIDAKHVQRLLLGLVQSLIASADHISNEVLDALFFFIIEPQKSQSRVSYRMAAEIIKQSCTTIEPWCVPFLSQAILTQEMPECKMTGAKRLDSIVYSLYEIVPETILTILPQMEGALTAANPEHRLNATKLLGDIFKLRDVNAADRVPQLWSVYIERSKDVNMEVRKQCIEQLPSIYLEHQSVRGEISTALGRRSDDDIEEVRLVAVRSIFEILRNRMDLATDVMLRQVRNHVHPREKKQSVRHECLMELSKIYSSMHTSGKSTASELATIADTMGGVFRFVSISMKEDRIALEKAFVLNIVSFKAPVETRVSMLLDLFVNIQDETPLKVLTTLLTMQGRRLRVIRSMWEAVRAANERNESMSADEKDAETYKKETEAMIHQLADTELEPHVIVNGLHKFAAYIEKEPRVFNALKEMLKGDYQCEQVEKHMLDIRRLLGAPETGMDEAERRQVRSFLERSVPLQVDNKIAVELSQRVQRLIRKTSCGNNEALAKMKPYLAAWKMIAEFFPQCFLHDEVALVTSDLLENDSSIVMEHALSIIISASRVRNCQQYLLKVFPDYVIERIEFIAKRGPPKAAKYAARCLCRILGRDRTSAVFSGMIEELVSHVDAKDGLCETALQTLAIILHAFPKEHAVQMRAMISEKLFNFVIRADTFSEERSPKREDESEAIPVKKPKEIRPQIMAFKFLYRYHRSLQTHKDSTVKKSIALWVQTINKKAANLSEQISEDNAYILMFYAANYLLKMSQYPVYKTLIATPEVLCCLSPIVYGFPPALRTLFLHRFQPLMNKNLLPVEFMALYMLAPLVKNDHEYVQAMTSSLHASLLNRWRLQSKSKSYGPEKASEYAVAFTISAFAFLSEWENPEDINLLKKYKKCLWMLLGAMNERRDSCCNLVLVRTILETLKMSESAWFPEEFSEEQRSDTNKKIWILADTALSLLYNRAKMTAAGNYRDINLSAQFFTYASSLKKTARKSFAPKEILDDDTESVTSTSTATRAHRDAEHASRSVSPAVNGTKGTRSKWLGHLVSDDAEESDTSKDISKQNGSLRRSRRGKNASMADSEPGPSTSKPAAIRQVKQEKDDSVGRAQRRTPVSPELLETPVIKRTRRPKVDRKELEAPAPAKPTRGRGRRRQKEEDASEEEEKPEEMAEKPKRGSRRGVATRKKEKSESPAEEADSDKAEEDEEIKSPTEDEEAQVRSSGRVRKKREIFDCSPIVSPTKQKPMTKMRRVDLESRFAAISPIVGTLASTSGPVSSTPNIPARRGRPKSKPKSVELPSRPSRNKKKMSFVGIDIGTTSLKLSVVDGDRKVLHSASKVHSAERPVEGHPERHEQDPRVILAVMDEILEEVDWSRVRKVCVSGQMHGVVLWDEETLEPATNLVTWMDARCDDSFLETLPTWRHSRMATGFGCATIVWLRRNGAIPEGRRIRAGTIMDFAVAKKTGRANVSMSLLNAYGFGLCEGHTWILEDPCLSEIVSPDTVVGKWLGTEADVLVASADLQTTLLPYCIEGVAVLNLGTSSQLCFSVPRLEAVSNATSGITVVPFFDGRWLLVAASLNGGNVVEHVAKTIVSWGAQLSRDASGDRRVDFDFVDAVLRDEEPTVPSCVSVASRFFGERHDSSSGATIYNWTETTTLRQFMKSVAVGVIDNIASMLSEKILLDYGIDTLRLTGKASFGVFRAAIERNFPRLHIEVPAEDVSAAYGAALQASTLKGWHVTL